MAATARITRDDLEGKLREISGDLEDTVESAKPKLLTGAATGVLVIGVLAYLLGRRRGRKRAAVVEIRRI
ncbi:MAG: hypothetical protein ABSH04_04435 [Acidimicrobiales bacterium]|jgi:hypothetical protein